MHTEYRKMHNLAQLVDSACGIHADKIAFRCLDQSITYAELRRQSRCLAHWLQHRGGLEAGDRVAIQLPNLIHYPIAAFAAIEAGLVVVNTNPLYTPREMRHQFVDSGAKAIVTLGQLLPGLEEIIDQTSISTVILADATDPGDRQKTRKAQYVSLHKVISAGTDLPPLAVSPARPRDIALLQYTGGTTGVAKGASLSHSNILHNTDQFLHAISDFARCRDNIFVCPLPLYHIYAFTVNMIGLFASGCTNLLIPNPRDLDSLVDQLRDVPFTGFSGLNTLFAGLCRHPGFRDLDFSHLRLTTSGGSALTSAAFESWQEVTGCTITEGYGLSETSPVVTINVPGRERLGTVGRPLVDSEIQIWDKSDRPVAAGEEGQIVVRGPQVMSGYWGRAEETAEAISADGFFRTGDVGVLLGDGSLKIVDRLKDMIIVSGFNVYPHEIEDVLSRHEKIIEAAVVGVADSKTGEAVCAHIVCGGELGEQEVIDHCREQLTGYKVPKKIVFHRELPKSSVGKILRRALRDN
ncbi:AMP-binding protein [Microbulbifer sp. TYP-18]|uniref:AMP-binding protein n=1 Tax=Microbulbifer sp. TYP-18 TaxID=3230024 RepID=UPI0034C6BC39